MLNNLTISGYDGSNDIRIFLSEAYKRCLSASMGDPVDFYEFEDNFSDIIIETGLIYFDFKGVTINRYELGVLLEDIILNEFKIEFINSFGRHVNDSQIIMFEELII